ncbi:FliM/FliN family flagellar motor switch protein [Pseudorhodobacter aquimaris]|uniref:FliM/FliN family flagellar motor switch protein n=1 Tax=Pseudorhodobacter aquimaris TaxID=687412 RepID=UPI0009FAF579|nr:FliM/FliN family flagellar motor C-terminal domain-containing protein [Pseudorhodobacter aquimaris]
MEHNGIKRKIDLSRKSAAPPEVKGAGRSWKLALARAARDAVDLDLVVSDLRQNRRSLTELLELLPERALIIMLEGPKDGLGLLVLSPEVLSGILEMQMVGKVSTAPPLTRRPTRTDAAMVAEMIDRALDGLEAELLQSADLIWASGFRYASFLEDARPLGLLLEDVSYRLLHADVSLSDGAKTGEVLLALPADGKGRQPKLLETTPNRAAAMVFGAALGQQVQEANVELIAVLARVKVPLDLTMHLKPGDQLPIGAAALDHIDIEGLDGVRLAGGKLGQNRGMRAVRLAEEGKPAAQVTQVKVLEAAPPTASAPVQKAG